ncbi:MAG: hypothetical protein QGG40_15455, partial [Myxococcota bacterium]|nr:hypothetical protein [Myxococcota bacterium]
KGYRGSMNPTTWTLMTRSVVVLCALCLGAAWLGATGWAVGIAITGGVLVFNLVLWDVLIRDMINASDGRGVPSGLVAVIVVKLVAIGLGFWILRGMVPVASILVAVTVFAGVLLTHGRAGGEAAPRRVG